MLDKFLDLISNVIKRPALFNIEKAEDIHLLISGYILGISETKDKDEVSAFTDRFNDFVNKKKDIDIEGNHHWVRLIRFYSSGNKHSIELFEKFFLEFLNEEKR